MKKFFKIILICTILVSTSCTNLTIENSSEINGGNRKMVTITYDEIFNAFRNPGKGWTVVDSMPLTPGLGSANIESYISTVYSNYFVWADLEPEEGEYRFDLIEEFARAWTDYKINDHLKVGISIGVYFPSHHPETYQVPEWLVEKDGMEGRLFKPMNEEKYEPYYFNPVFLEYWTKFVQNLAEYYYKSSYLQEKLEYINIGPYGMWSEWHSYGFPWPDENVKYETLKYFVDLYNDSFYDKNNRPEFVMHANRYDGISDEPFREKAIDYAVKELGFSMRRDSMGWEDATHRDEKEYIKENWINSRFLGEWGLVLDTPEKIIKGIDMALDLHSSTLDWWSRGLYFDTTKYPGTDLTLNEYYQINSGYRLVLKEMSFLSEFKKGEEIELNQVWEQVAVARMYKNYPMKLWLVNDENDYDLGIDYNFDSTQWVKGNEYKITSTFKIPDNIPSGEYEMRFALVDSITGEPAINLANSGKEIKDLNEYSRYIIGNVIIVE